jgi:hypothetical protein
MWLTTIGSGVVDGGWHVGVKDGWGGRMWWRKAGQMWLKKRETDGGGVRCGGPAFPLCTTPSS